MTGWICPKCGRVYAPSCQQCLFCNLNTPTLICHKCKKPFRSDSLKFTDEGLLCAFCYYPKIEVGENENAD